MSDGWTDGRNCQVIYLVTLRQACFASPPQLIQCCTTQVENTAEKTNKKKRKSQVAASLTACRSDEALHSASPELHLTLYEFESASDCEWATSNIAPHLCSAYNQTNTGFEKFRQIAFNRLLLGTFFGLNPMSSDSASMMMDTSQSRAHQALEPLHAAFRNRAPLQQKDENNSKCIFLVYYK